MLCCCEDQQQAVRSQYTNTETGITPAEIPTISFSIGESELGQLDAEAMAGDFAAWNYFQSIASEENKQFVASFQEMYGPQRVVTDPMEAEYVGIKLGPRRSKRLKASR